jgi:hypothetical protein
MELGGRLRIWGVGAVLALALGGWLFSKPLPRTLLILAALAAVAVGVWRLFRQHNPQLVNVTIGVVIALAILPINGYLHTRPSEANFCRVYVEEKRTYLEKYGRTTGEPFQDLANGLGAMSAWVPMFDRLAKVAPDEIQSDVEHIRDSLKEQQSAAGQAIGDPLGALGRGLISGLMTMDSWQRVGSYVDQHCGDG